MLLLPFFLEDKTTTTTTATTITTTTTMMIIKSQFTAGLSIVMFSVVDTLSPEALVTLMMYGLVSCSALGVPEMVPVAASRFRPSGNLGKDETVTSRPTIVGVTGSIFFLATRFSACTSYLMLLGAPGTQLRMGSSHSPSALQ